MGTNTWVEPLILSGAISLAAVPLARRVAVVTGFLDKPAPHKGHSKPTPYLGGVAICLAILVTVLVERSTLHSGVIGVAAGILFITGLVDDRRGVDPLVKLAIQGACALVVFFIGFHLQAEGIWLHWTSNQTANLIPTFLLFILMPNSVNLLDNTDGLAAGVVAASAACVLAETVVRSQTELSIAAAAVEGALLGFLVFNRRPASIFMGDAGSLPLGLLLAVMAVRAGVGVPAPDGAVVSLMLVGLPLADTATVFAARIINGRSIFTGGQDHLSHRLAAVGIPIGWATWILIGTQALLGGLGLAVATGHLAWWAASAAAAVLLGALVGFCLRPAITRIVYRKAEPGVAAVAN
ncbi:MAG TPA: MraY family glycosyltransferase [Acidimicrobiales bacterium]|nr:MraY family glycosyltransferase [Acidimicrobiales bacterium]